MAKYTIDDIAQLINEDVREHNVPVISEQDGPSGIPPRFAHLKNNKGILPSAGKNEGPRKPKTIAQRVADRKEKREKEEKSGKEGDKTPTGSGKGHTRKLKNKREEMRRTGKPVAPKKKKTAAEEKAERRAMKQLENLHGEKGSNKDKEEPKPLSDSINRLMYMLQEAGTHIGTTRELNKKRAAHNGSPISSATTWFQQQYNKLKARFNGGSNNPEFQKAVQELKRKADEAKRMGAADYHDEPGVAVPGNQHTNNLHSKHHPVNGPADPDPKVARMLSKRRHHETWKQGQKELDRRAADPSIAPATPANVNQKRYASDKNAMGYEGRTGWNWAQYDRNHEGE